MAWSDEPADLVRRCSRARQSFVHELECLLRTVEGTDLSDPSDAELRDLAEVFRTAHNRLVSLRTLRALARARTRAA